MICYVDTSALIKRYIQEEGSDHFQELFLRSEAVVTSALTEIELIATFDRSRRMRRLDSPGYLQVSSALEKDLRDCSLSLLEISAEILNVAKQASRQRHLRAPDAIQLASALFLGRHGATDLQFLCADRSLLEAARLEGMHCQDVAR